MQELEYRIAKSADFEAIHRLNYETFVEEIPQHAPNAQRRLVDRFHDENTYAVCLAGGALVGMVCGRCQRPFSLDQKLPALDQWLPAHRKVVEIRLLAVKREYRKTSVFFGLMQALSRHFIELGCDLAVISGTVRELKLYRHLGFVPFGDLVGTAEARYQPMYLTLAAFERCPAIKARHRERPMNAGFLTGPVTLRPEVREAFDAPPVSHRGREFVELIARTREALVRLVNAPRVALMVGSGTLANDAVAAQLRALETPGLILSNGEFGSRLVDHARRWKLPFAVATQEWGRAFDWTLVGAIARRCQPRWIWAVLTETSTGILNPLAELRALSEKLNADLCLDAVSAVGLMPVDLAGVRFATAVSGKGLAAFPGLAAVFHDGRLAGAADIPRYLDLAVYETDEGVPFTHSSNLVAALERSLAVTDWPAKFENVRRHSVELRDALREHSLAPLACDEEAAPGVVTLQVRAEMSSVAVARALARKGIEVAWQSRYLRERNWLQIALMGEIDEAALRRLPALLSALLRDGLGTRGAVVLREGDAARGVAALQDLS